ncbi:MAG: hypothetical protein WD716_10505 [Fimbriimonadaceae bacterium]
MNVSGQIDEWIKEGRTVGFCPWDDADGLLFGVIVSREGDTLRVSEISPCGQPDGTESYDLGSISYFVLDDPYIERLRLLSQFDPKKRGSTRFVRQKEKVTEVLTRAARTNEPVSVRLLAEPSPMTVTVTWIDDDWIGLQIYDDLMAPTERRTVRSNLVLGVRAGTMVEERAAYLLKARQAAV